MKITDKEFRILRSEYGNWFFFFLPHFNICGYDKYLTVSMGWLVFHYSFYIDLRKK